MSADPRAAVSLEPESGWHCAHLFYRFDRARLRTLGPNELDDGCAEFIKALSPAEGDGPARLQTLVISGQKADFGAIVLDPDPLVVDGVHQRIMAGELGPAVVPVWSFVSLTEVSQYLRTPEQYAERLAEDGLGPGDPEHRKRLQRYRRRWEIMVRQRLHPDLPNWPAVCFYPMNRRRDDQANWFLLGLDQRQRLMDEHGQSGMEFAGRVTQLVTAGIGLDDWEWGVTLWARNPELLKQIVYRMRFDEASARYADFGPFYTGYLSPPDRILEHCRVCRP
ncbi:MAG TPA: heme-dependent peroxidase [Planctomycetaceae bacterium]|nr:heme-dependent peroxidase [Planctomycetaceae bacterium]